VEDLLVHIKPTTDYKWGGI